jgi:hypothetical protein
MRKRSVIVAAGVATATALALGTPASAFECYNAQRSDKGNAAAAGSEALISAEEFLAGVVGLCPDGVEFVIAGLGEQGFDTDFLINGHTIMASGLEGKHEDKLHDGSGIDHLSEDFIAAADELIGEAFGLCPPPG